MSIEALLERMVTAVEANTQALQVLEAGRQVSLEQLKKAAEAGETAQPRTRRKKADEAPAGNDVGSADAGSTAEPPAASPSTAQPADTVFDQAAAREEVTTYIAVDKEANVEKIKAIIQHFGGSQLFGPTSTLDDDQRRQAMFYVRRYAGGGTVDYGQDYDFAGDPMQGAAAAVAADEFDIG